MVELYNQSKAPLRASKGENLFKKNLQDLLLQSPEQDNLILMVLKIAHVCLLKEIILLIKYENLLLEVISNRTQEEKEVHLQIEILILHNNGVLSPINQQSKIPIKIQVIQHLFHQFKKPQTLLNLVTKIIFT